MHEIPPALKSPSPELAAAWEKFIHHDDNCGHAQRGYQGSNLAAHLQFIWHSVCGSAARVAKQTPGLQPQAILDLGASGGGISLALCAEYPDATVYALEPEDEAFELLSAMKSATGEARLKIFHGAGEQIPLPDASVDLIVCHTVLEHVRDPQRVIAEMFRVLRPGGIVHLELPNYIWPVEPHLNTFFIPFTGNAMMKFLGRLQGLSAERANFINHLQLITKLGLERIMRAAGFRFHNLAADKIFARGNEGGHEVLSGWKRTLLGRLQNNSFGKMMLRAVIWLGLYPSLLYRLEKP